MRTITSIIYGLMLVGFAGNAFANNLSISNISVGNRNPSAKTIDVSFDISWQNSWRNKINHDATWLIVRLQKEDGSSAKEICLQAAAGLNPASTSVGSNAALELHVPADKVGVLLRRKLNGVPASVSSTKVMLPINYASCGFADNDQVSVNVYGLEMVYVPQGSFFAGDYATSTSALSKGSADATPWLISSESAMTVTNPASGGFRYTSSANPGEFSTGTNFVIPANYPKGYNAFYAMKYEITEGQWVDFVNSLPVAARLNRDITDNQHKNADSVYSRNTVSCAGSPLVCTTNRPWRATGFLSWMDVAAFLDFWGLRPMTELEFEKLARGPLVPVKGEYVWASTAATVATTLSATENGTEVVTNPLANIQANNQTLSGGDSSSDPQQAQGPLRAGIFAVSGASRESAGGSFYGAMELSGNVAERVVSMGNAQGLLFLGSNGDGRLTSSGSFEGNATNSDWPGINADSSKGINAALGSGLRGGSFSSTLNQAQVSDRTQAALTTTAADPSWGGRGVRTYDGT